MSAANSIRVRARVPEKQGLKPKTISYRLIDCRSPGASSRKTRIETENSRGSGGGEEGVRARVPEKQGLKQDLARILRRDPEVRARVPEKQGLKPAGSGLQQMVR